MLLDALRSPSPEPQDGYFQYITLRHASERRASLLTLANSRLVQQGFRVLHKFVVDDPELPQNFPFFSWQPGHVTEQMVDEFFAHPGV